MKIKDLKNTKAITLIAMVVTIVVLLILAGVSISTLTGENGIITGAMEAKEKTEIAKEQELVNMAVVSARLGQNPDINYNVLKKNIKSSFGTEAMTDMVVDNEETGKVGYIIRLPNGNVYPVETKKGLKDIFIPENDSSGSYDVKVKGYKMEIGKKIGLRFYFTMPEEKINSGTETIKLTIGTKDPQVINISRSTVYKETVNEEQCYYVESKIASYEMSQNINFCAYNNNIQDSKEYNYSIKQFGNEIISHKDLYATTKKQELGYFMKALLNLGGKIQVYGSRYTNNLANEGIEIDDSYITADYLQKYERKSEGSGIEIRVALGFTDNFLRIDFCVMVNQGEIDNYKVILDGKETKNYQWMNGYSYMVHSECELGKFSEVHTCYLLDNSGEICSKVYSASNYAILNLYLSTYYNTSSQQELIGLIKSLIVLDEAYIQYMNE